MTRQELCQRFYDFVKKRHKLNSPVPITYYDQDSIHLVKQDIMVGGYVALKKNQLAIHIPIQGHIYEVFESIAHEHKHCMQREAGAWTEKDPSLLPWDHPLEQEARAFAKQVLAEYQTWVRDIPPPRAEPLALPLEPNDSPELRAVKLWLAENS